MEDWSGEDIWHFYNFRGNAENHIKEAKYGFSVDQFSSQNFDANKAMQGLKLLAYNLLSEVGKDLGIFTPFVYLSVVGEEVCDVSGGFYYEYCPEGIESRYELLVFDHQDEPFLPLTDFYHDCIGRIDKSSSLSYLQGLLPFFDWLSRKSIFQGNRVSWSDHPETVRVAVEDYLMSKMACKVREKDTFRFVNLTQESPNTVNRYLTAIKSFYKSMTRLKQYPYQNPLIDANAILSDYRRSVEGVRAGKPRMVSVAGTEEPIPARRLTDSFFKLINDEWEPQILDDPSLPYQVCQAGKKANWSQREMVIARMLFETGARASEVIELTVGDYRSRKSFQETVALSKGSHGRRVKFLRFGRDTTKRLDHYIKTERKLFDPDHFTLNELPDDAPIFLTKWGTPLTYDA